MNPFLVGDHVENKPIAIVDGIVHRVDGDIVVFCDECGTSYRMNHGSLRSRYREFTPQEEAVIMKVNAYKFKHSG